MSLFRRTTLLVANQIGSRILTFLLNVWVAREVGKELFGIQAIHLHLLANTIHSLSREGLRKAMPRFSLQSCASPALHLCQMINLAWMAVVASVLCMLALVQIFLLWPPPEVAKFSSDYSLAVWVYGLSAVVEMLAEPAYSTAQNQLRVGLRVKLDSAATVVRALCSYFFVCQRGAGLMGFAYGRLAYALAVATGYYLYCLCGSIHPGFQCLSQLFPHSIKDSPRIDHASFRLTCNFTLMSLQKALLTEGTKLVFLGISTSLEEQGVYGLVSNLGALVARILFQPLEESMFAEFSRSLSPGSTSASVGRAVGLLNRVVRLLVLVGGAAVAFGPNYSFVFLDLFYGNKWSEGTAPEALSWYCVYLLVMGVNGITGAFFFSAVSHKQLAAFNGVSLGISLGFVGVCALLQSFGAKGLIAANGLHMFVRVMYNVRFIRASFPLALPWSVCPPWSVLLAFAVCFAVTRLSLSQLPMTAHSLKAFLPHIGVGVVCSLALLASIWVSQRAFVAELSRKILSLR